MPISTIGSNSLNQTSDLTINGQTVGKGGGNVATNTAHGVSALAANTSGSLNVAVGSSALLNNTSGAAIVAVGSQALKANTTGSDNTVVGRDAGLANTTGGSLSALGQGALLSNTTGSNSVAIGSEALRGNTTASNNTAVGYQAGYANTTGDYQSLLGLNAGAGITTGVRNTCLGAQAGNHTTPITTGNYNVIIGSFTTPSASAGANQIVIGYDCQGIGDNYFTFGKSGNRVYNQFTANASWTQSSDERLKTNIKNDVLGLEFICKLKPRTYTWKPSNEVPEELTGHYKENNEKDTNVVMNGFIAQEVKEALDFVGSPTFSGWSIEPDGTQAVSREMFVLPLVKAIQELKTIVDAQAAEIAELKAKVA
jgi:trimeric autotransporter adhesin